MALLAYKFHISNYFYYCFTDLYTLLYSSFYVYYDLYIILDFFYSLLDFSVSIIKVIFKVINILYYIFYYSFYFGLTVSYGYIDIAKIGYALYFNDKGESSKERNLDSMGGDRLAISAIDR